MPDNEFDFRTPLSSMRFQSQLGKETRRQYKEGNNIVRLSLAKVVKVNYKYNTVDVVTTQHKNVLMKNPSDNGRFSARLPVQLGGKTPDGKPYGSTTLVTTGSLVLIGFLEGNKDYPIVLNIYSDSDNQSQLTRTTFTSADESDENIQRELWQLFTLYPSMTYKNIDGRGNQEVTFSGKSFMYTTDTDPSNEYVNDSEFDYDHLPSSRYADGELIEPTSSQAPTVLYVHQGIHSQHRVTFFIKSDGTVRLGSRHTDGGGITFQEMNTDGSFSIVQQRGSTNPEDETNEEGSTPQQYSHFKITRQGSILLQGRNHVLEIHPTRGVLVNGRPIGSSGGNNGGGHDPDLSEIWEELDGLGKQIIDTNVSLGIVDGKIQAKADATIVDDLEGQIEYHQAQLEIAFDRISSKVGREEYDIDLESVREYAEELLSDITIEFDELYDSIQQLDEYIEGAFKDGVIEESEAKIIEKYINSLNSEKADVDAKYREIFYNENLRGATKDNLENAKNSFDEAHDDLILAINNAIADGRATPAEAELVNSRFANYNQSLGALSEAFEKAVDTISLNRAQNARFDAERYAKEYADGLKESIDRELSDIFDGLEDLDEYINNAFRDGVIEESEAKAIEKYINSLDADMKDVQARYNSISNNSYLSETVGAQLTTRWENFYARHNDLIDTINTAIEDGRTTQAEAQAVNQAFTNYTNSLSLLSDAFERAIDVIAQNKANEAEFNAEQYADDLKDGLMIEIDDVTDRIEDLNGYIDGAFKDGVIEESEAKAIEKYINTLNSEKADIDNRYYSIYYNTYLDEEMQVALGSAKQAYDTVHDELIDTINVAISDGKTTPQEANAVNLKFTEYATAISDLSTALEAAIDNIASNRAKEAEKNATDWARQEFVKVSSDIEQLADRITQAVTREEVTSEFDTIKGEQERIEREMEEKFERTDQDIEEIREGSNFYRAEIISTGGTVFRNGGVDTTLFCRVHRGADDVTDQLNASQFNWTRVSSDSEGDTAWNNQKGRGTKSVNLTRDDVVLQAMFTCEITE